MENNRNVFVNDMSSHREVMKEIQQYFKMPKVHNVMLIPINSATKQKATILLVLANKYQYMPMHEETHRKRLYENFQLYKMPCTNKLLQNLICHMVQYSELAIHFDEEQKEESNVFKLMDRIFASPSNANFIKEVEKTFETMFNVERCNFILVHRHKKFLYRIRRDPKT